MYKYIILLILLIQNTCWGVSKFDLNAVCEVISSDKPDNEEDWSADIGTGLVVFADDEQLYIVISDYLANKVVKFVWTKDTQPFYAENINPQLNYEAFGKFVKQSQEHELALYSIPLIKDAQIIMPKLAEPKAFERLTLIIKDYNKENLFNNYYFVYGTELFKVERKNNDTLNKNVEVKCLYGDPMGGGVILNNNDEVVCFINYVKMQKGKKKIIGGPSGGTIKNFLERLSEKEGEVPAAPE